MNFAMNGLGSEGAEAMGKALKVNRTLLQLDLSFNRIPQIGAGYLAVGLQTNDTLQGLKVILGYPIFERKNKNKNKNVKTSFYLDDNFSNLPDVWSSFKCLRLMSYRNVNIFV